MMCVPGEPCPENGRSPGSVSTHHSSPRSDYATYTNTYSNSNHAVPTSNASPPEGFASHSLQTSDVVIHRKENEGFGFVIISSLNRPESGSTISKWLLCLHLNKRSSFHCLVVGDPRQADQRNVVFINKCAAWKSQATVTTKASLTLDQSNCWLRLRKNTRLPLMSPQTHNPHESSSFILYWEENKAEWCKSLDVRKGALLFHRMTDMRPRHRAWQELGHAGPHTPLERSVDYRLNPWEPLEGFKW